MSTYEILSLAIGALTLIVMGLSLAYLYKTFKADHERRKKQATIEYVSEIREKYRPLWRKLRQNHGEDPINPQQLTDEDSIQVRELLTTLGQLATGVNLGVFDLQIVNKMSGTYYMSIYDSLKPYIEHSRRRTGNVNQYDQFELMCSHLLTFRLNYPQAGEIEHS